MSQSIVSDNGYSYFIADDDGNILPKSYKHELQRIDLPKGVIQNLDRENHELQIRSVEIKENWKS